MGYEPTDDGYSAASWLGAFTDTIHSEFREYWGLTDGPFAPELTEQARLHFAALNRVAEALTPCLSTLAISDDVFAATTTWMESLGVAAEDAAADRSLVAKVARGISSHPVIRDRIQIDLAYHATDTLLADAEARVAALVALVSHRRLSDRAAAFLDRATKHFLWGFGLEAIVMRAAVLGAAYEASFSEEELVRIGVIEGGTRPTAFATSVLQGKLDFSLRWRWMPRRE